jgi:hypothetical protein
MPPAFAMVFGSFTGQGKRLLKGTQPCRKGATPQYLSSHIHLFLAWRSDYLRRRFDKMRKGWMVNPYPVAAGWSEPARKALF